MNWNQKSHLDLAVISAEEFGRSLRGFGINLLVSDVSRCCQFLHGVFGFEVLRQSRDFAIVQHRNILYQVHADTTYSNHPLPAILPEIGPRGAGVELRLYDVDPDLAEQRARAHGAEVLQRSTDKPHGLRECYLLDPDGYCWVPSIPK